MCHPLSSLPTLPTLQDSTGCSALHVSISCKQPQCSGILLSHPNIDLTQQDKSGNTPFAAALAARDHQAGLAILKRELKAAEQVKSHSRTRYQQNTHTLLSHPQASPGMYHRSGNFRVAFFRVRNVRVFIFRRVAK